MKEETLKLAIELYKDLPFYKRWKIKRYYLLNNWDVSGEWEKCLLVARRMVENAEYLSTNPHSGLK